MSARPRPHLHRHPALLAALLAAIPLPSAAGVRRAVRPRPAYHCPPGASCSVGRASCGRLYNPAHLSACDTVRYLPRGQQRYGTTELVSLLDRTSRAMWSRYRLPLTVGDLSAPEGGRLRHHNSHQSGRDADVAFYVVDPGGRSVLLDDWVVFRRDGTAARNPQLRFDTARNWALVQALLEDPVPVEHIFVSNGLRALLLTYARTVNAPADVIAEASVLLHQPGEETLPHNDHFHVRVACRPGDARCVDAGRGMILRAQRAVAAAQRAVAQRVPAGDAAGGSAPRAPGAR